MGPATDHENGRLSGLVIRHLDQVAVGVAAVDGAERPCGAGAFDRAHLDRHAAGRLEKVGSEHAKRKPPSNLDAYDYLLRGRECYVPFTPEESLERAKIASSGQSAHHCAASGKSP